MPNKVYINPEATRTWSDAGTASDETMDLGGLAADAARLGDRWDTGAGARAEWYEWRLIIDGFNTSPVVGESVDAYLAFSDGTNANGNVGITDGSLNIEVLPNLQYLGSAVVQSTSVAQSLITSGVVRIASRYVSPVVHNNTVDALNSTSDSHKFILTPIPYEVQ
jgi:hypothetical protein